MVKAYTDSVIIFNLKWICCIGNINKKPLKQIEKNKQDSLVCECKVTGDHPLVMISFRLTSMQALIWDETLCNGHPTLFEATSVCLVV